MATEIKIQVALKAKHQVHLSRLAVIHYAGIDEQNEDMIRKFIQLAPWAAWPALSWRGPQDARELGSITAIIRLSPDTADLTTSTIDQINLINRRTLHATQITPQIFVATAIHWWIHHVYPMPLTQYN